MASCMVAVDRAHEHNGALNVLKGSHKLGRLNHAREATAGEVRRASPCCLTRTYWQAYVLAEEAHVLDPTDIGL